ncbi:MAG: hypothetical protein V4689_15965 [Verrucomicrobiota bacterium]
MKPSVEQIGNLLALKRDERPEEGYWQDFLCEFHQNQREQAVKTSGLMSFAGRVSDWFSELGSSKWAYGAGLAYASIMAFALLTPREPGVDKMTPVPVNYQVVPAPAPPPVEQLNQLDLSPSTQGNAGEQVF